MFYNLVVMQTAVIINTIGSINFLRLSSGIVANAMCKSSMAHLGQDEYRVVQDFASGLCAAFAASVTYSVTGISIPHNVYNYINFEKEDDN